MTDYYELPHCLVKDREIPSQCHGITRATIRIQTYCHPVKDPVVVIQGSPTLHSWSAAHEYIQPECCVEDIAGLPYEAFTLVERFESVAPNHGQYCLVDVWEGGHAEHVEISDAEIIELMGGFLPLHPHAEYPVAPGLVNGREVA